jgi:hypothetical protein
MGFGVLPLHEKFLFLERKGQSRIDTHPGSA